MSTTTRRTPTRALTLIAALLFVATTLTISAPGAHAAAMAPASTTTATAPAPMTARARAIAFGARVVRIASSRRGSPYVYGGSGPHRFDCSGLTMWTFNRLSRHLPHSAAAQYGRTRHIRARDRRPGDLVFFHDGGGIYHVGIYAGHNEIWHAPYPGARVRKERLWTRSVYYGRVG
ncbi:MAG: NlpC/P60 family protein [Marmoricola sp.]|nr:NlpC/P60 family protein [Marmoricola sp.]